MFNGHEKYLHLYSELLFIPTPRHDTLTQYIPATVPLFYSTGQVLYTLRSFQLLIPQVLQAEFLKQASPEQSVKNHLLRGRHLDAQWRGQVACMHSMLECLGSSTGSAPDSSFLQIANWVAAGESSRFGCLQPMWQTQIEFLVLGSAWPSRSCCRDLGVKSRDWARSKLWTRNSFLVSHLPSRGPGTSAITCSTFTSRNVHLSFSVHLNKYLRVWLLGLC